ncbi:hypothetical protein F7725_006233 [Dissostichus mawsoni]|uniref:Uncharacterized protein n=1 Tax=Dissostichus mawsoni TaxID=36200 RepID=A0A7J5YXM3_DISMA|nr:hypothetical protein F7725_006233 [Dissostichus mawsoni]
MIDERLQNNQEVETDITFEVSLKQHICADAARRFQKMHEDFIQKNDPYRCLNKNKEKFLADFKDVFHNVDQCQKKAEEFTDRCLKPAVERFVNRSLGPDIIGKCLQELGDKLVISQGALGAFMILNKADQEQFAHWLFKSVKDMAHALREKFKKTNILTKLQNLHVNPQNELFNKLIGCGKQCPFCASPCEAGGTGQHEHFTSLHRPEGLVSI